MWDSRWDSTVDSMVDSGWIPLRCDQASWIVLYIFGPSHSLRAELPLPSSCCKGEACFPRLHYKGKP